MPAAPNPLLSGNAWTDLAGQQVDDVNEELKKRRQAQQAQMQPSPPGQPPMMPSIMAPPAMGSYGR